MAEVVAICKKHRLYFFSGIDRGRHVYLVYRRRPEGDERPGGLRAGKCRGGERALLNQVRRIAGITAAPAAKETAF